MERRTHGYDWSPTDYVKHSCGQETWGRELIAQLGVEPEDDVLDLGCGDGRLTALLAEQASRGRALGVDLSPDMIRLARDTFGDRPNLRFEVGNVTEIAFEAEFTKVFSNAALHWVEDHRTVLRGIARALRPGGRCLLQMGGAGNAARVIEAFQASADPRWPDLLSAAHTYTFHDDATYRRLLAEAGLRPIDVRLIEKDLRHDSVDAFRGWLRTTWQPYLSRAEADQRDALLDVVIQRYLAICPADPDGGVHVAMVRLQVAAEKPAGDGTGERHPELRREVPEAPEAPEARG